MKCQNHPGEEAPWRCVACGRSFCAKCVKMFAAAGASIATCPVCGERCEDVTQSEEAVVAREPSFWHRLPGIFAYPVRKDGPIILIAGAVFFALVDLAASWIIFRIIVWVFAGGYLFRYFLSVIYDSAMGSPTPPTWPEADPSGFLGDCFNALLRFLAPAVVSYAPAVGYLVFGSQGLDRTFALLVIAGSLYYPMCLTAIAFFDQITAMDPVPIICSIFRVPLSYLATCMIYIAILFSLNYVRLVDRLIHVSILSFLVRWLIALYLWTTAMHLLGMFYHANRHKLKWG